IGETTDNTKKNYGIKGITNGIGLATLQNGFVRNTDYSAGIFGESKTATNIITYGVMGKTASTNEQAAGVFGIAELGGSDGVRGISVGTSKGSAGSFLNYATSNSTPTVYISNQDVKDSAAALFVDGGQIVKVEVVTSNHLQNLGDYIIVADNSPQIITLLDPATVPQGTIIIVRNTGSGAMQIALATCISPLSTIDVYSTELQTVVSGVPVYGIMQSGSGNNKVITAIVKTSLKFVSTKTSATVGTWIEY
ncbi:MAG: hypothetical protein H7331_07195, partial [Bacteroidia bacterium]|nr:hypothetical protein [Bacteroidia bacterium]